MKFRYFAIIALISLFLFSCKSTDVPAPKEEIPAPVESESLPDSAEIIEEPAEVAEPVPPEKPAENIPDEVEEIEEVKEVYNFDDEVEDVTDEDDEYLRSIDEIEIEEDIITREEFAKDKAKILELIEDLDEIMTGFYFDRWKAYIAPESIKYYSNQANLKKAQKKLPDKTIQLKGLKDYFRYVFIPSRQSRSIEEIRYISKTYIKAIEMDEDGTPIVYYYFVKEGDEWLISLPEV